MNKEQATEINLLLATFRCFNEQLYNIKGSHKGILKQKFNRLINVSRQYENEIVKMTNDSKDIENIYDHLMEILILVKKQVNE
tara:strand:+ start:626 stop:874 length:249 start_codon:yes stop_codon:yes gene_type:complete